MKNKLKLIILSSSMLLASAVLLPSFGTNRNEDVIETVGDVLHNHTIKKQVQEIAEGEEKEVFISKTFVQYGITEYEGNEVYVMRFATALKGDISSISYLRESVDGLADAEPQIVDSVYRGINASGSTYYYHPEASEDGLTTDVNYAGDYWWACFSIRFVSGNYYDTDFTVSLTVNDELLSTRTAKLNALIETDHVCTPKYVEATVTCEEDGNVAYYACDCGKLYLDETATQEVNEADLAKTALGHNEVTNNAGKTYCDRCDKIFKYEFDAHDPRVIFDGKSKTITDYCGGSNNDPHDIIYYVNSDRDTTVDLYSINSAINGKWEIAYNKTWKVFVDDVEYTSSTVHANTNSLGITSSERFTAWHEEFVNTVSLKQGVNKIIFDATGAESLNFKGIVLKETNAEISLATCGLCETCSSNACGSEGCTCSESYNIKAYDEAVTFTDGFKISDVVAIGHSGYKAGATITIKVNASEATTATLDLIMTGDKNGLAFKDYYSLKVNGEDATSDAMNVVGEKWKTIGTVSMDTINLQQGENTIEIIYTENGAIGKYVCNFVSFMFKDVANGSITW